MKTVISMLALVVAGCVTTSPVVPVGKDTYMVTASNDACGNCSEPQIRAAQQANAYCASISKVMIARDTAEQTFDIGFGHKRTLTFSCVAPDDPEYTHSK